MSPGAPVPLCRHELHALGNIRGVHHGIEGISRQLAIVVVVVLAKPGLNNFLSGRRPGQAEPPRTSRQSRLEVLSPQSPGPEIRASSVWS